MPGDFNMTVQNDPLDVAVKSVENVPNLNVHVDNMPAGGSTGSVAGELVFDGDLTIPANAEQNQEFILEVPVPDNPDSEGRYRLVVHGDSDVPYDPQYGVDMAQLVLWNRYDIGGQMRRGAPQPLVTMGEQVVQFYGGITPVQVSTIAVYPTPFAYVYSVREWLLGDGPSLVVGTRWQTANVWDELRIQVQVRRV